MGSQCLLLLLLLLCAGAAAGATAMSEDHSAYEELEAFGFPAGLLPHRVSGYSLNRRSGEFSLAMDAPCAALLQGMYLVSYGETISGVVSYGSIKRLKGVSVRAFFIDWTITGMYVRNHDLVFQVGLASAKFPLSNFDESPECADQLQQQQQLSSAV